MFNEVAWASLDHAYGSATDVPDLLAKTAGNDKDAALQAIGSLYASVGHQGDVCSASPPVVDIALRLATCPDTVVRAELVGLAAGLCRSNDFKRFWVDLIAVARGQAEDATTFRFAGGNWLPQCRATAMAHFEQITAFTTDADASVRHASAYLLPTLTEEAPRALQALQNAYEQETDAAVQASMTLAVAELSAAADCDLDTTAAWLRQLMAAEDAPPIVGLAAVIAYRWHSHFDLTEETAVALSKVVPGVTQDDLNACRWLDDVEWDGGLVAWLMRLYPNNPHRLGELASTLLTTETALIRKSAATACLKLARNTTPGQWPDPPVPPVDEVTARQLVIAAAETLTDTDPAVRYTTATQMTRLGRRSAWARDELAAATTDADPQVAAWATAALANCGDERAIDPLNRMLAESVCPWVGFDGTTFAMLYPMHPYAARLRLSLQTHFHRHDDESWWTVNNALIKGISSWGADASELATAIWFRMMKGGCHPETAIKALGSIGPAATIAIPNLVAWSQDTETDNSLRAVSTWAHWRITGRTHPAVTVLRALAGQPPYDALDYLADMGPIARSAAPIVEPLLEDNYQWNRIHAAYTLWRLTGRSEPAVPTLIAAAATLGADRGYPQAAMWAINRLADIGLPAVAAVPVLDDILNDPARLVKAEWPHHDHHDDRQPIDVIHDTQRALQRAVG